MGLQLQLTVSSVGKGSSHTGPAPHFLEPKLLDVPNCRIKSPLFVLKRTVGAGDGLDLSCTSGLDKGLFDKYALGRTSPAGQSYAYPVSGVGGCSSHSLFTTPKQVGVVQARHTSFLSHAVSLSPKLLWALTPQKNISFFVVFLLFLFPPRLPFLFSFSGLRSGPHCHIL